MTIRRLPDCTECNGRMFEANGHGVFHAETGTQTCPERPDPEKVRRLIRKIIERDQELLKRLAEW